MAKRKRLSGPQAAYLGGPGEEPTPRAPIARVAGETSTAAALEAVTEELVRAREDGRMVLRIPLSEIDHTYLVRDRLSAGDEEMEALVASIRDRGQQTPVEVVALQGSGYGLISGWRRCQAIARLQDWGLGDGMVLALERRPDTASDAYRAMIEENEIRVGLSYFERARIVDVAVEQGVFDSHKKALQILFSSASRAKRSKIGSFVILAQLLADRLRFPTAIGERLGLRLARLLDLYPDKAAMLYTDLALAPHGSAEDELAWLTGWVAQAEADEKAVVVRAEGAASHPSRPAPVDARPRRDLLARFHPGENRLVLSGAGLTEDLRVDLIAWLTSRDD